MLTRQNDEKSPRSATLPHFGANHRDSSASPQNDLIGCQVRNFYYNVLTPAVGNPHGLHRVTLQP